MLRAAAHMITRQIEGLALEVQSPSVYLTVGLPYVLLYETTGWWVYSIAEETPHRLHERGFRSVNIAARQLAAGLKEASAS